MKASSASSFLRHIWVGGIFCFLFLAGTGVAYANAANNGTSGKADGAAKQELVINQVDPPKKKADTASAAKETKPEVKQAEVKKEGAQSGYFSFSFLYYLFYKTNFTESTNEALRNSINSLVSRLID